MPAWDGRRDGEGRKHHENAKHCLDPLGSHVLHSIRRFEAVPFQCLYPQFNCRMDRCERCIPGIPGNFERTSLSRAELTDEAMLGLGHLHHASQVGARLVRDEFEEPLVLFGCPPRWQPSVRRDRWLSESCCNLVLQQFVKDSSVAVPVSVARGRSRDVCLHERYLPIEHGHAEGRHQHVASEVSRSGVRSDPGQEKSDGRRVEAL